MIKIRKASINDLKTLINFQIEMAVETENFKLNNENVKRGVKAVFNNSSKGEYYIAEEKNKIIGSFLITPEWSDWKNGTILWIQSVFVIPEYRKKGVFKKMYIHMKRIVDNSEKYLGLRLYVNKKNIVAQKTYEKIGMDNKRYKIYEWIK